MLAYFFQTISTCAALLMSLASRKRAR